MSGFILFAAVLFLTFKLSQCDTTLRILHTNLFRSYFEGKVKGKPRGGIARIIEYVNKQKAQYKETLYFDTMDWFGGSVWYSVHKMTICTEFMNILRVDALGLGDGEMYDGNAHTMENNFWKYLNSICDKTILCANCHILSDFEGSACINKSKVIEVAHTKVGVTAYIDRHLVPWQFFRRMRFTNESEAVNREIESLTEQGVDKIIVIGHGDYNFNAYVLKRLKHVDLLIGGHSRTLLYNGNPPSGTSKGPYPQEMKDANGEKVLVVYAGENGFYVGKIALTFNANGEVIKYGGNAKYMGSKIKEDPTALKILEKFRPAVENYTTQVVGRSRVYLQGYCVNRECNLGNLLMDAFIHYRANQMSGSKGRYWTDAAIAFVNSGCMKSPIAVENKTVVMAELMASLPYNDALFTITLNGSILKQVFEHSGQLLEQGSPGFLQVAGVHVVYDLNKTPEERVVSLKVRCAKCKIPLYEDVKDNEIYKVVTTKFIVDGGDGYTFDGARSKEIHGSSDVDVLKKYFEFYNTVQTGNQERIIILKKIIPTKSRSSEYMKEKISRNLLIVMCMLQYCDIMDYVFAIIRISVSFKSPTLLNIFLTRLKFEI